MNAKSKAAQQPSVRDFLKEMRELRDRSWRPRERDGQFRYDSLRQAFLKLMEAA